MELVGASDSDASRKASITAAAGRSEDAQHACRSDAELEELSQNPSCRDTAIERLFVMEGCHNIGADYDPTLMAWFERFDNHWSELAYEYGERSTACGSSIC